MSASPPKDTEVEQGDPTPENSGDRDMDTEGARDIPYNELDVKEQDRWLPIANGWLLMCILLQSNQLLIPHTQCTSAGNTNEFAGNTEARASEVAARKRPEHSDCC